MGFKTGLLIGAAIGYYYGARAGRQRYEQIERVLEPLRESEAYRTATESLQRLAGSAVRETASRAREVAFGTERPAISLQRDAS